MMKYKWYYWAVLTPKIRDSLEKRYSRQFGDAAVDKGRQIYKDLLKDAPDLGPGNPMECNAYFAYVFVAVWLGSGKLISTVAMGQIMEDVLKKMRPLFSLLNINSKKGSRYWYHSMKKYEQWYEKYGKQYPATWEVHFDESLHKDGSYYYFTRCPICDYLQNIGIGQIMEPLCATDKLMFEMQHGVLHRDCTLAKGQCMCDYWIVGDRVKDPR